MIHVTIIQIKSGDETAEFQTMHFTKCFKQRHCRWTACINSQVDYTEGNNIHEMLLLLYIQSRSHLITVHMFQHSKMTTGMYSASTG